MPNVNTIFFVTAYGKIVEMDFVMASRDTIEDILEVRISGNSYRCIPFERQNKLISIAEAHGVNFYEWAADYAAEQRETHHMLEN